MPLQTIATRQAPQAIGPYTQAVRVGNLLFCSGQIPIDPATGEVRLFDGDIKKQTSLVLHNLSAIVTAAGGTLADVAKTTVYLARMGDFAAMNAAYAAAFGAHKPARATVEVARLPKDVAVEIDAVAWIDNAGKRAEKPNADRMV